MTSHNPPTHGTVMPYQRYLDATHAARDQYLATTYAAHRMYLTGPWPDRTTYQQVENSAWTTYYAAAREAWQRYTAEVAPPEPLPVRIPPDTNNPENRPWPTGYEVPGPAQPTYTPTPKGDQ